MRLESRQERSFSKGCKIGGKVHTLRERIKLQSLDHIENKASAGLNLGKIAAGERIVALLVF